MANMLDQPLSAVLTSTATHTIAERIDGASNQKLWQEHATPTDIICNCIGLRKSTSLSSGWFNSVLKIKIDVDSDLRLKDPGILSLNSQYIPQSQIPLIDITNPINGTITFYTRDECGVWVKGVSVYLEEHLVLLDDDSATLVRTISTELECSGFIRDGQSFKFTLPLKRTRVLRETYIGEVFSWKHILIVRAHRPWYTFDVLKYFPILIQKISPAPPEASFLSYGCLNEEGGPNTTMIISDCNGRAEFLFERDAYDMDSVLNGKIVFQNIEKPIAGVHLIIIRTEILDNISYETVIGEHTLIGQSCDEGLFNRPLKRHNTDKVIIDTQDSNLDLDTIASPFIEFRHKNASSSQQDGCIQNPILGCKELDVTLNFEEMPIAPSIPYYKIRDSGRGIEVKYFIRLVLEECEEIDGSRAYWNTHEIYFHRARIQSEDRDE